MSANDKYDALKHRRCKACAAWHNPDGMPIGMCVLDPGQAFIIMQMPPPNALMVGSRPPPGPMPSVQSSSIPKGPDDGCLHWLARTENLN